MVERLRRSRIVRRAAAAIAVVLVALCPGAVAVLWSAFQDTVDGSAAGGGCLAVGAFVEPDPGQGGDHGAFAAADRALGPLTVRRSFDRSLPRRFQESAAAGDADAGLRSFVSWKPPGGDHRGAAAGRYDEQVAAWARSVPRTGVYATAFHEPENDMSAAEFVAMHRRLYTVVTRANPTISWGPVYMGYWWDPGRPDHYVGDPHAWWPGTRFADFVGFDWYGSEPAPMTTSRSFEHWYATMAPTQLPLLVVEYGQYEVRPGERSDPARERARAQAIRQDAAWITARPQFRMWLYWQARGVHDGDWRMRDAASQQAWREVAARGCPVTRPAQRASGGR